jgi:hypothetical protein
MNYNTPKSSFLSRYKSLIEPGTYRLQVRSVSKEAILNVNTKQYEHIINFYACAPSRMKPEALNYIKKNDVIDVSSEVMKGQTLTFNQRIGNYIPSQGETVLVEVDFRHSKSQGKNVLVVTSCKAVPVSEVNSDMNWSMVLGGAQTPVNEEPEEDFQMEPVAEFAEAQEGGDLPF